MDSWAHRIACFLGAFLSCCRPTLWMGCWKATIPSLHTKPSISYIWRFCLCYFSERAVPFLQFPVNDALHANILYRTCFNSVALQSHVRGLPGGHFVTVQTPETYAEPKYEGGKQHMTSWRSGHAVWLIIFTVMFTPIVSKGIFMILEQSRKKWQRHDSL